MTIPSGVQKSVIIGKEGATTWGTAAAAGVGKQMRRTKCMLNLVKGTYQSNEIRTDYQVTDYRHGMRHIEGTLDGELSCKSYQDLFAAAFMNAWAAGSTTGALTTLSVAVNAFSRSAGSFVTDGFKVGDLIKSSGFTNAVNNGDFIVTAVVAGTLTVDGATLVTEAAGATATIQVDGKKLTVPSTAQTNDSFTIEQFYEMGTTDVDELATGNRISKFDINVQPGGMATVSFGFMGKDMTTGSAAYFTTPAALDVTGDMSGAVGYLYVNGVAVAIATGVSISGTRDAQIGEVVGSLTTPDVFMGRFKISGQISLYFLNSANWSHFANEDEMSLVFRLNGAAGTGEYFVINLPRIKFGGNTKDDKEVGGIIETIPFVALKYIGAGNYDGTTMVLQDTKAA